MAFTIVECPELMTIHEEGIDNKFAMPGVGTCNLV
jgi:hypothetical protein